MRTVLVPDSTLVHLPAPRGGGTYNLRTTVCDMGEHDLLQPSKDEPTCPFCIRDSRLPADVKDGLMKRLGLA